MIDASLPALNRWRLLWGAGAVMDGMARNHGFQGVVAQGRGGRIRTARVRISRFEPRSRP